MMGITIYKTVILVRSVIKFLDRNFLIVENHRDIEKNEVLKLYSTSCQNNNVKGNFMKNLCTCLISMAVSRSNKLRNKVEVKI